MMPNTTDLLAGRPPYLPEQIDPEPARHGESRPRHSGDYLKALGRIANRLMALLF